MTKGGNTRVRRPPVVFVSYSYDSAEHVQWVVEFATKLRSEANVNAILDQWDLDHGEDIVKFMERNVRRANRVLMICTTSYVHKANEGRGGAGYETMVVTAELVRDLGTNKFIPIIPPENVSALLPTCLSTRKYVDFRNPEHFEVSFRELVTSLHSRRHTDKPDLGIDPRFMWSGSQAESILQLELNLDDTFAGAPVEFSRLTRNLVFSLKQGRPKTLRVLYPELKELEVNIDAHLKNPDISNDNALQVLDFVSEKKKRAKLIQATVDLLFSTQVNEQWSYLLVSESDWQKVFSGILNYFSSGGRTAQGLTKIDIWRTAEPELSAPIFVTDEELTTILQARGLSDKMQLAFGPGWVAADELPDAILVGKALPRILISLGNERDGIPDAYLESTLSLFSWHVGLG